MHPAIIDVDIETADPALFHEKIILPKLKKQLKYVISHSHFYRNKYKKAGFDSSKLFRSFDQIPFTEKAEIIGDQNGHPPFGSNLSVDYSQINRVHRTAGTTGRPVFLAMTRKDIDVVTFTGRRCFWASGVRPGNVIVHCLNYCLWAGGYTDHQSIERTGAAVVPYGVGNSRGLIDTILYLMPTAIHCTPSYLSKLEIILENEYKKDPRELGLKLGLFGGEGGSQNPAFRKRIEDRWGLVAMNANYGLSEVHSMFGADCLKRKGMHFMAQEYLLPELINPVTREVIPIEKGKSGELVLTNLEREAQPLVRFRTHDTIKILDHKACSCGRTSFRFEILGRNDDMLVVKGINVYPNAIKDVLTEFHEFGGEFQLVVEDKEPVEKILLRVEMDMPGRFPKNETVGRISGRLKQVLNINPSIEIIEKGGLPRTEGKTKRVVRIKR
jgi:phenylacetate-CoA ligase